MGTFQTIPPTKDRHPLQKHRENWQGQQRQEEVWKLNWIKGRCSGRSRGRRGKEPTEPCWDRAAVTGTSEQPQNAPVPSKEKEQQEVSAAESHRVKGNYIFPVLWPCSEVEVRESTFPAGIGVQREGTEAALATPSPATAQSRHGQGGVKASL